MQLRRPKWRPVPDRSAHAHRACIRSCVLISTFYTAVPQSIAHQCGLGQSALPIMSESGTKRTYHVSAVTPGFEVKRALYRPLRRGSIYKYTTWQHMSERPHADRANIESAPSINRPVPMDKPGFLPQLDTKPFVSSHNVMFLSWATDDGLFCRVTHHGLRRDKQQSSVCRPHRYRCPGNLFRIA